MARAAGHDAQGEVLAFLADPGSYPGRPGGVERHETHGAVVFLVGDEAYKVKRAVLFPYMDFSTLERRREMCEREVAVNRPNAPELYLGVMAITRDAGGALKLGGAGPAVEWAVHMRRFEQDDLLSNIAQKGTLEGGLVERVADAVATYHRNAPVVTGVDGAARLERDLDELDEAFAQAPDLFRPEEVRDLVQQSRARLRRVSPCLRERAAQGHFRRCHGDLHLRNIVLWRGAPVLFDAIEFNDDIAALDTLYDLAFLLMDLEQRGQRRSANQVLGRYLWRTRQGSDLDGLAALPLMLALRAGIRAMVAADLRKQQEGEAAERAGREAREYFKAARGYLKTERPRLVAVGGLSGTGKSTLAAGLAPCLAPPPGALHLRSDLERKALFGAEPTERLGQEAYTEEVTARVYRAIAERAGRALAAGHSVIADAVYAAPAERAAIERVAAETGARFDGLWLTASADALKARVGARTGDASDATVEVVERQLGYETGAVTWQVLDAGGSAEAVLEEGRRRLGV